MFCACCFQMKFGHRARGQVRSQKAEFYLLPFHSVSKNITGIYAGTDFLWSIHLSTAREDAIVSNDERKERRL